MPGRSQTLYLMEMLMAGYYLRFIEAIQSAYTTFSAFLTSGPSRPEWQRHLPPLQMGQGPSMTASSMQAAAWQIDPKDLQFCKDVQGDVVCLLRLDDVQVYKAVWQRSTEVVVDVIQLQTKKAKTTLLPEIERMFGLKHKNIVAFIGAHIEGDQIMLVKEFMPRGNLSWQALPSDDWPGVWYDRHSDCKGGVWYDRGHSVALDVARALCYLHEADVLHLDITPLNVMLARDRTAKVPYGSFARLEATTRGRTYSCPFPWASPEMLLATGCSKASDVFSFGVLLWSLASAEGPRRPIRPLRVPQEAPQEVAELVDHCTKQEPTDRPNMQEVLDVLQRLEALPPATAMQGESQPAVPPFSAGPSSQSTMISRSSKQAPAWKITLKDLRFCRDKQGKRYTVGMGGFGQVIKAKLQGSSVVAVKVMHQQQTEKIKRAFLREIELLCSLEHPNIVAFYGANVEGEEIMLVTEFMPHGNLSGQNLSNIGLPGVWLDRHSDCNVWYGRGRSVALDVARALCYLHERNILHLEITPFHVLLARDMSAKVACGALARLITANVGRTYAGYTPWASPEVLLATGFSKASDVFSFGVLLWSLASSFMDWPQRPIRPLRVPQEAPEHLAKLVVHCTKQEPTERPTMREVLDVLEHLEALPLATATAQGESQPAAPPSPPGHTSQSMMTGSSSMQDPGQRIDLRDLEFCKDEKGKNISLGMGKFGQVYKAVWQKSLVVAVKVMLQQQEEKPEKVKRDFLREIQLLCSLRHPNILGYLGAVIEGNQIMLVTEYMPRGDLLSALSTVDRERLPCVWYRWGHRVALDVAQALYNMHEANKLHLDVKSGNVLLASDMTAKVADVGLARTLTSCPASKVGTFDWASPEMLLAGRCSTASDVFSFGVLLWELASAERPLRGQLRELRSAQTAVA